MKRPWTAEEDRILREMYPTHYCYEVAFVLWRGESSVYQRADALGLKKDPAFLKAELHRQAERLKTAGAPFRKRKGERAWNKGRHYIPGGRCSAGWFPRGHRAANHQEVGALRICTGGYVEMKIAEGLRCWRMLHVILWEDEHGPVPKGHIVVMKDRDRMNVVPENLELITRAENMRRNTIHNRLPHELKRVVMTLGQLNRRIREREHRQSA